MATVRRWDPFGEMLSLRDAMSQLLEDSVVSPARLSNGTTFGIPLNVSETQEGYVVEAVVPGLKPGDLDITIQDNVLTIRGETRRETQEGQQASYHLLERRYGRLSRSVTLPMSVQADQVKATLEHGILHLELPKAEQVKPRKITVAAGSNGSEQTIDMQPEQSKTLGA